jgi:hypothetical protein
VIDAGWVAHVTAATTRDVVYPNFIAPTDRMGIEDNHIGETARGQLTPIGNVPSPGEIRGEALHGPLEGHAPFLPHEFLE